MLARCPPSLNLLPPPGRAPNPASDCTRTHARTHSGWPADLPPPETLAGANVKDAEGLAELAGDYAAAAAFSRNWQLRDAALQHATQVGGGDGDGRRAGRCWRSVSARARARARRGAGRRPEERRGEQHMTMGSGAAAAPGCAQLVKSGQAGGAARGLVRLAVRALKDKVPNVFAAALTLYQVGRREQVPGRAHADTPTGLHTRRNPRPLAPNPWSRATMRHGTVSPAGPAGRLWPRAGRRGGRRGGAARAAGEAVRS